MTAPSHAKYTELYDVVRFIYALGITEEHERQRVDGQHKHIKDKEQEELVVSQTYAIIHPGAMVIHFNDAAITD